MKVLVTGAGGFLGKNLISEIKNQKLAEVLEVTRSTNEEEFERFCATADVVFHLAGTNRPKEESEFTTGNVNFTHKLVSTLAQKGNNAPIFFSSSIQAEMDNAYGRSKNEAEEVLFNHGTANDSKVFIYRLPNLFGKWGKPNYNSVIATFCHKIARGEAIQVTDPEVELNLAYVDDVIDAFLDGLKNLKNWETGFKEVKVTHRVKLGRIAELIQGFKQSRLDQSLPDFSDAFQKKLYSTYLNYLPTDDFSYDLKMNVDERGSFTEILRTQDRGQVSVNIAKPGIVKGNHWHHTKNEKFLVVSGNGVIRFRDIFSEEVIEYHVSGEKMEVLDIPTGYTHNIENVGTTDLVTVMWANEAFDPDHPDTYFLEV